MVYAVDFVVNVMKELSSSDPVLFQRDGSLYVASAEGFGRVSHGLCTNPHYFQNNMKQIPFPEILESEDAICTVGDEPNKKRDFKETERGYLEAIKFGPDTYQFTLEEVIKSAQELAKLPDDGKIRMILHGSGYHSHKYGYACDGTDVWVQEARVMNRDRYLELLREREDKLIQAMEQVGNIGERRDINEIYRKLEIPDCVIITPYLKVSLPRSGTLHFDRDEPDSWTERTRMELNHHQNIDTFTESPFAVYVTINARDLHGYTREDLKSQEDEFTTKLSKQLSAVNSNMSLVQEFIDRINAVHNKVCAPNIEWRKDLRKRKAG